MSFYDVFGKVTAKVPSIDVARKVLRHYITIFSNDAGLFVLRDEPRIDGEGNLILYMAPAVRLTDDEVSIIDSIGNKDNYEDHVRDIFTGRMMVDGISFDNGADPDEIDDIISEYMFNLEHDTDMSTLDILSEINATEARVDCQISSSGSVYNHHEVQTPGGDLEIIEHYRNDGSNQYALVSQDKIADLTHDRSNNCEFDFEEIESLLWLSLSELNAFSGNTKVITPQVTANEESYDYRLIIVFGDNTLTTTFKYKAPENKRLRAKKHIRLFATVTSSGHALWTGSDPDELKDVLNDWVAVKRSVVTAATGP